MNQIPSIPNQTENIEVVPSSEESRLPEVSLGAVESAPEAVIESQPSSVAVEQPPQNILATDATAVAPVSDAPITDNSVADPVVNNVPTVNDVVGSKLDSTWIQKAEAIIKKDKDDPYQEEEDHEDLQEEYLKQRFGKTLKSND